MSALEGREVHGVVYYLAAIGVMLLVAWVGLVQVAWRDQSLVAGGFALILLGGSPGTDTCSLWRSGTTPTEAADSQTGAPGHREGRHARRPLAV